MLFANPASAHLIASAGGLNAGLASYETIKRWVLLPVDLTVENGFLTPTMKVKRKKVEAEFQDLLDGFYAGAVQAI